MSNPIAIDHFGALYFFIIYFVDHCFCHGSCAFTHGCNLVGNTGSFPPTFSDGGDI